MPVYVYRCRDCGSQLEIRQSYSDAPLTQCEACGGQLQKVLQPTTVIFKGSGFYSTDHRPTSGGNGRNGEGAADKTGGEKPDTSTGKAVSTKPPSDAAKDSGSTITASTASEKDR